MSRKGSFTALACALGMVVALSGCNQQPGQAMGGADGGASASADTAAASAAAPRYADVISVTPVTRTVNKPTQECHDETVTHKKPVKDSHQIAGTAIGAVVGGVLGNQVGKGKGRKLATLAGAIGGGYAGKKIQEHEQDTNTYTTTEKRCKTVDHKRTVVVAYTVKYRYQGEVHTKRMDHKPGKRIEMR